MPVTDDVKTVVKKRYGAIASEVEKGRDASCCGPVSCGCGSGTDAITGNLYDAGQVEGLPAEAVIASLGCGNPTALAELRAGETVLDLGSGGGIDVLLSAKRVGPSGKAYGLDMTDEMLTLARENQRKAGVENVEFLKGEIEQIPLPDASVDVIISNCVINLSADKNRVLAEAYRVLRPVASPSRTWSDDVTCRRCSSAASSSGSAAWPARSTNVSIETSSRRRVSNRSFWNRPGSTAPMTRGRFWNRPASDGRTPTRSTGRSRACSCEQRNPL